MPDNSSQKSSLPFRPGDVPLAVKDGVREVRFRLRRSARKLAESVDAVAHPTDRASEVQPFALLAEPLGLALRTTARMLRYADRAAVHFLGTDGPFQDLSTPLPSSASYFVSDSGPEELRAFTEDHFWRYKHWLRAKGWSDIFVHEQGFDRAGQQLIASGFASSTDDSDAPLEEVHLQRAAEVVLALRAASIFTLDPCPGNDVRSNPDDLAWHAALCTVLAGEIASSLDVAPEHQTTTALVLADEITTAARASWERNLQSGHHIASIVQWLGLVLRHL